MGCWCAIYRVGAALEGFEGRVFEWERHSAQTRLIVFWIFFSKRVGQFAAGVR